MTSFRTITLATMLATLCLTTADADAAIKQRSHASHGPASCQAALPVFDANFRKRPKAFANEGTSTAFVTCDFESLEVFPTAEERTFSISILFINRNSASQMVSCTLVDGQGDINRWVETRSANIAGNSGPSAIDFGGSIADDYRFPALSCAIPPGVEISLVRRTYFEDVGF